MRPLSVAPGRLTRPLAGLGRRRSERSASAPAERRREIVTYWLYRAAERVINRLPRALVLPAAAAVGNVAYDLGGAKRRLLHENLARPMALSRDDPRVAHAARRAFRNYAKYLVDMMRIGELTDVDGERLVRLENVHLLDEARAKGGGVLLCTAHVGGMDLLGSGLKRLGESLYVVADDTSYGRLYDHLAAARAKQNIFLIGWRNLRGLFKALRAGHNLVLFCDGGYRRGDVPVEFCGEPTTFPVGPATLAAKSGAALLPVACQRTADDRFVGRGLPLITCSSTEPSEVYRATQAVADALTSVIAEDPSQWYMFRDVWPRTDGERAHARAALDAARRGDDWSKVPA